LIDPAWIHDDRLWGPLADHLERAWPREGCGLLLQHPDGALALQPCQNISTEPDQYEIDPLELLRALRRGAAPRAIFHAHCDRPPLLSELDLRRALTLGRPTWPDCDHLVASVNQGRVRRAILWRFDPSSGHFIAAASRQTP
jgi:proteasome lid subunit RPN8/RPN11